MSVKITMPQKEFFHICLTPTLKFLTEGIPGVFLFNFEHISHLFLFPLLTSNK